MDKTSRRAYLKSLAAAAALTASPGPGCTRRLAVSAAGPPHEHERRIAWWRQARFGMFITWGVYSIAGRQGEWLMGQEDIPVAEYEEMARRFKPKPNAPREWARLAKRVGMKYMVLTTKHHEGFCLFDSKLTDYCAPRQGPGRDLVREYVDAARAEGLRVGFYYSLMDWHHPDGFRAEYDAPARKRFVDYTYGQLRELLTNYGKVDILWYDLPVPLDAQGWQSERMNKMVFDLQPDIIVNNRNWLPGDFSTPEQSIQAAKGDWESCMTLNDNWGYLAADDNWKTPKRVVRNLVDCARDGGNYLLNIGPKGDGSVPEEALRIFGTVGGWIQRNASALYDTERCRVRLSNLAGFTRKGNTLYTHVHAWPGGTVTVGGIKVKVISARLLASNKEVKFTQKGTQLIFSGLPAKPPDDPVTVIAAKCDSEPVQDSLASRSIDILFGLIGKQNGQRSS